jgi:uncharacterized membrane protein (Fun14 family)
MSEEKKWDLSIQDYADKAMKLAEKATDNYLEAITRMYLAVIASALIIGAAAFIMGFLLGRMK